MKRYLIGMVLAVALFAMAGCGGGDDHVDLFETLISSDVAVDGDIVDHADGGREVTFANTVPGILAGVDPDNDDVYRAFLSFPLTDIPVTDAISSATLSIVIRSVTVLPPTIRIELVSFDPTLNPPLIEPYFDEVFFAQPLAVIYTPSITSADGRRKVNINVTSLMREAQLLGLDDFQVRISQVNDFTTSFPRLLEINEDETIADEPQLTVFHFE